VDLAKSGIGVAVRSGAPHVDISSGEAVKAALLGAKSIAYSKGAERRLYRRPVAEMGVADQLKSRITPVANGVPVGAVVAKGDAEIGFQQVSELLPVKGIDFLAPLPGDIQEITVFLRRAARSGRRQGAGEVPDVARGGAGDPAEGHGAWVTENRPPAHPSRMKGLASAPMPVISTSTTSPDVRSGEAPSVPIQTTSPG
jgi:hypothetical protein